MWEFTDLLAPVVVSGAGGWGGGWELLMFGVRRLFDFLCGGVCSWSGGLVVLGVVVLAECGGVAGVRVRRGMTKGHEFGGEAESLKGGVEAGSQKETRGLK
jgi:hypothetical protein